MRPGSTFLAGRDGHSVFHISEEILVGHRHPGPMIDACLGVELFGSEDRRENTHVGIIGEGDRSARSETCSKFSDSAWFY